LFKETLELLELLLLELLLLLLLLLLLPLLLLLLLEDELLLWEELSRTYKLFQDWRLAERGVARADETSRRTVAKRMENIFREGY